MAFFDLPLDQLQTFLPQRNEPADFDAFWQETLEEARRWPIDPRFQGVDTGLRLLSCEDVTFRGSGGQLIRGWLLAPRVSDGPLPCVVQYIGYGGGRGFPSDWLHWPSCGYATLVMDTRGQGSQWLHGDTPDLEPDGSSPHAPGFVTRGILSPRTYYYRRLITDAVRALEAAAAHPRVDAGRLAVTGNSQGGGLALCAAGLSGEVRACMAQVPFLSAIRRATQITDSQPYAEIAQYCKVHRDQIEAVFATLAYFDGMNFAARGRAPALFSVGLMDDTCPPSTVFAAYNHYAGPKQIRVYEYNQHEGGGSHHLQEQTRFLQQYLV